MKYTNFKTVALMLSASALLVFSGCGTEGVPSEHQLAESVPVTPPVTPVPVPDAATSTVTASPASVTANGKETSIVTVTVNDASSNPITDATVTLAQTGTSTISTVTNVGDGTYTFNVNSTTVETVTYTATADSVVITQTTDVAFTELSEAECLFAAGGYEAIVVGSRTWLDRNLGAGEVAANVNDPAAFGDLYQWGRAAEGHEDRASALTPGGTGDADTILPNTEKAWDGLFINEGQNGTNYDWTKGNVDPTGSERAVLWGSPSSASNLNQVCPCGYIVPSGTEFTGLNSTEIAALKLTLSGWRDTNGTIQPGNGAYWTSEERSDTALSITFDGSLLVLSPLNERSEGGTIRCIKP